jgi:hypothetical protein
MWLSPEAGGGVCAALRDWSRPSCDKLAHPTPPRRIVCGDRNAHPTRNGNEDETHFARSSHAPAPLRSRRAMLLPA